MKPKLRILGNRFIYVIKLRRLILLLIVLLFCVVNIIVTLTVQKKLLPVVNAYAITYAKKEAVQRTNVAIENSIANNNVTYSDFYTLVRNQNGDITSIEINTSGVNIFKTNLINSVESNINHNQQLKIPVGNVFENLFFMGRGPGIPIKLNTFGFTTAEISGEFSAAGINQTRHSVFITVKTEVSVVLPYKIQNVMVETKVPVAETVIVGNVPSLYPFSAKH